MLPLSNKQKQAIKDKLATITTLTNKQADYVIKYRFANGNVAVTYFCDGEAHQTAVYNWLGVEVD